MEGQGQTFCKITALLKSTFGLSMASKPDPRAVLIVSSNAFFETWNDSTMKTCPVGLITRIPSLLYRPRVRMTSLRQLHYFVNRLPTQDARHAISLFNGFH